MLESLLERFDETQDQLHSAIQDDRHDLIARMDKQADSALRQLLDYEPESNTDFLSICRFLVGQMQRFDALSPTKERLGRRLLALIEEYAVRKVPEPA